MARPLGVAVHNAPRGARVSVAMSGAVDVFDMLVPGCRYLCIYIYIYIYIYVCVCVCICVYIHIYMYECSVRVWVAMSGALDVLDMLVPGCRYL